MTYVRNLIYPDLSRFPSTERAQALEGARELPLDVIELLGIAAGLVCATALTRYGVAGLSVSGRVVFALVNFLVAVPLIVLLVGPFLVRRTRRGLRAALQRRGAVTRGAP